MYDASNCDMRFILRSVREMWNGMLLKYASLLINGLHDALALFTNYTFKNSINLMGKINMRFIAV